jgi:uncharacterized protein (TIGR04255 family)
MPLIRPEAPRALFERSPLRGVICQVQFAPILALNDPVFIASFQEDLRPEYPNLGRVGGVEVVVGPSGVEAKEAEQGSSWLFATADGDWAVVLAPSGLSLRAERYTRFEDLRERFLWVLERCIQHFAPAPRTRLGLRYINRMEFADVTAIGEWRPLVRSELFGIAGSDEVADDAVITHSLGQTRFAQEESQLLARYGFLSGAMAIDDAVTTDAAATVHFLLDFDHFDVRSFPTLDPEQIAEQLEYFHDETHRLFRWCLTEEGTRRLGIVEDSVEPVRADREQAR